MFAYLPWRRKSLDFGNYAHTVGTLIADHGHKESWSYLCLLGNRSSIMKWTGKLVGGGNLEHRLFFIFLAVCAIKKSEDERRWILVASSTTANVCPKLLVQFRRQNWIFPARNPRHIARLISRQMIIAKKQCFLHETKKHNNHSYTGWSPSGALHYCYPGILERS